MKAATTQWPTTGTCWGLRCLFNHLIGTHQERLGDSEHQRSRGLEVDGQTNAGIATPAPNSSN
jgi:hypothetical protein